MTYTYYQLCWFLLFYSMAGWCAGVIANAVKKRKFVNTGFMGLPLCPSYGIGALCFCIFLPELKHEPFFLFLGGSILGAFICVMTGIILEHIFHRKWWDFSKSRFQFEGYMRIWHLLLFGVCAVLVMWVINPLLLHLLSLVPFWMGEMALTAIYAVTGIDLAVSVIAVLELKIRIRRMERLAENMQRVTEDFGNAITGRIQKRMMRAYPNLEAEKLKRAERERKKSGVFAQGCGFCKLFWLFFIGAFIGDIIETLFCRVSMGYWMSRSSVVYGPFSIVWGLGCAILTAILYKYKDKSDRYIFMAGTVLGGAYEYICSVFTELVFGTIFWDYSAIPFNLGGRINLLYCFFWGIAAVVWLKFIYPKLSVLIEKIPMKTGMVLTTICVVFMLFNGALSSLALSRYSERQIAQTKEAEGMFSDGLKNFLDKHFPDERMEKIYPKAKVVDE